MAVATTTATNANIDQPYLETGIYLTKPIKYVAAARTVGDTLFMMKIPNHTTIVEVYTNITTAETAANATVGITSDGTLFGSTTAGGVNMLSSRNGALPYKYSVSDTNTDQYTHIVVMPSSASWTTTATIIVQASITSGMPPYA